MPNKYCVSGCNGNSSSEDKTRVFKFPNEPILGHQWIRAVPIQDWTPGNNSVVCERHFHSDEIVTVDTYLRASGDFIEVHRKMQKMIVS